MWPVRRTWETKLSIGGLLLRVWVCNLPLYQQNNLVLTRRARFCGSTADFCEKKCQKNFGACGKVKRPSCGTASGTTDGVFIGYYESWSNTRKCQSVSPEDLNLRGSTHINFAFVFFHPQTYEIVPMNKNAGDLLHRFTKLKEKKPACRHGSASVDGPSTIVGASHFLHHFTTTGRRANQQHSRSKSNSIQ